MRKYSLLAAFSALCLLLPCAQAMSKEGSPPRFQKHQPVPPPFIDGQWHNAGIKNTRYSGTYYMELENGWLIYHYRGHSGSMTFVPKPGYPASPSPNPAQ